MKTSVVKDIINSFVSIIKGHWITLIHWSPLRPSVTELYPDVQPKLSERFRGLPVLPVNPETGRSKCIACGACARMCPQHTITVVADKSDPKNRKPAEFTIDASRCIFCGLCVEVCPQKCLQHARTFELACYTREQMVYHLEDLMRLGGTLPPEPKNEDLQPKTED